MMIRARLVAAFLAITVLLACTGTPQPSSSANPTAPTGSASAETPRPDQVTVSQTAALLTGAGQTLQLSATALSAEGSALDVTWRSSDPAQVTVDADGTVTAVADLGSALVFAEAGNRSTPVAVLIAEPAPGALLVSDDQVVGPPERVQPGTGFAANGTRMRVLLRGVSVPGPGTILIASGSAEVAGRVLSATIAGEVTTVEYELAPLPDLLARYSIGLDVPLDVRDAADEPQAGADTRPIAAVGNGWADPAVPLAAEAEKKVEAEFKKGPLKCSASASAKFKSTDFDIKATTNLSLQVEGRKTAFASTPEHTKVVLTGPLALDVFGGLRAEAGFEGKAECALVKHIPIPLGGILAVVLAITVPIGLSAGAEGKITAVSVELGPKGHLGTTVTVGFECDSTACWAVKDQVPDQNNGVTFETKVDVVRNMRVDASVALNVVTGLGARFGEDYSLIDAKVGPVQSLSLAFDEDQVRNAGYASSYDLKVEASVTPGDDLKSAISRLFGGEVTLDLSTKWTPEQALAESPKGTLNAEKSRVQVGKPVKLFVNLEPKTIDYFLVGPNVAEVRIARVKDGVYEHLANIPVTASRQTKFEWTWTPTKDYVGMNELVALVVSNGVPLAPLEIAPDSRAYVEVVEACLPDTTPPPPAPPAPGTSVGATAPPVPGASERPPADPCGQGTVTITREKHGTYISNRSNPVQVDMVDSATITFELVADEYSEDSFQAPTSSITWSYSLTATEPADECTILERGEGGGTFAGEGGPALTLGFETDGTIFGMQINEDSYVLNALPPTLEMEDGDPRGFYRVWNDVCGLPSLDSWWPYAALGFVSGPIPEGGGTFSGSRQRTLEPLSTLDVPIVETITWSFTLE